MAQVRLPDPVLLVVAAFSRHYTLFTEACTALESLFGPVTLTSLPYDFTQTTYYRAAMGSGLKKVFFVFHDLVCAESLAKIKLQTNSLEEAVAAGQLYEEQRPLNLDPGILTLGKFMLATTKDQAQRIYLQDGIYAEVTLRFEAGEFSPWPWTYADYRQPCVLAFFKEAREFYRRRLMEDKSRLEKGAGR
jgi:hypothetical protein